MSCTYSLSNNSSCFAIYAFNWYDVIWREVSLAALSLIVDHQMTKIKFSNKLNSPPIFPATLTPHACAHGHLLYLHSSVVHAQCMQRRQPPLFHALGVGRDQINRSSCSIILPILLVLTSAHTHTHTTQTLRILGL